MVETRKVLDIGDYYSLTLDLDNFKLVQTNDDSDTLAPQILTIDGLSSLGILYLTRRRTDGFVTSYTLINHDRCDLVQDLSDPEPDIYPKVNRTIFNPQGEIVARQIWQLYRDRKTRTFYRSDLESHQEP